MIDVFMRQHRAGCPIARRQLLLLIEQWTEHPEVVLSRLATNCIQADDLERYSRAARPTAKEKVEASV